jgi:hypothetical protein
MPLKPLTGNFKTQKIIGLSSINYTYSLAQRSKTLQIRFHAAGANIIPLQGEVPTLSVSRSACGSADERRRAEEEIVSIVQVQRRGLLHKFWVLFGGRGLFGRYHETVVNE